ncbi:MAG: acyl-CoA synthetase (AMP-forming)/AMP-acid ligase II, partial [Saprospiraceae bacterium]
KPKIKDMIYLTQSIHRNAQIYPNLPATVNGDRTHTWKELKDRIARLAGGLKKMNIQDNDRIAILSLNSDRYLEYYYAIPWAGCSVVPLNIRWSAKENSYSITDAGAKILFVDDTFAPMVSALKADGVELSHVIYMGDKECPEGMEDYEELIESNNPAEDAERHNDDLAGIFYTGGTTGFPKGVMLTHTSIWASSASTVAVIAMKPSSRYLHAAPMFHLADEAMLQCAVMIGATNHFIPSFTPAGVTNTIAAQKITHVLLVPVMIQMTVAELKSKSCDQSSLEYVIYGASPISEASLIDAMTAWPSVKFAQGYGQTELSPIATILTWEYHTTSGPNSGYLKSAGKAIACTEVRIVDKEGKEVDRKEIGEIAVKGANAMQGYWNKPEETAKSMRNGWIHTGDAGYMDDEGFVFLVDRVKDMIVSGGENVYSAETENAIMNHPAIAQAVVIGIPNEKWGEQVHAEVILHDGMVASADDIIAECAKHIANYKCPRSVIIRTEPFPMSGAGKLLKKDVRAPYWEGKTRMIG